MFTPVRSLTLRVAPTLALAAALVAVPALASAQMHTSKPFTGAKVNKGTVTHSMQNGKNTLTLSGDFQNPRWKHSNGAWARAEIWGCLAPGRPSLAARLAWEDACVDHGVRGEGTLAVCTLKDQEGTTGTLDLLSKGI